MADELAVDTSTWIEISCDKCKTVNLYHPDIVDGVTQCFGCLQLKCPENIIADTKPAPHKEQEEINKMIDLQQALTDLYLLTSWAEIGLRQNLSVIGGTKPDITALQRRMKTVILTSEFLKTENNVQWLKDAVVYLQNKIRILEGRPDSAQTDLFENQGENND